jgi:hypothetical protein
MVMGCLFIHVSASSVLFFIFKIFQKSPFRKC